MEKQTKVKNSKNKYGTLRKWVVVVFLFVVTSVILIKFRGEYLETLEIGEKYLSIFWTNFKYRVGIFIISFVLLFLTFYLTNNRIKKGLINFFKDDKKVMPKLPNKSISFIVSIIISIFSTNVILQKVLLIFNSASFGVKDRIFGYDISYYLFVQPFIEFLILYVISLIILATVYMAIYYIVIFNTQLDGVKVETLKSGIISNQIITNIKFLAIALAIFTFISTQNLSSNSFLSIGNYSLCGLGFVDINIKLWGYRILSILIIISVFWAVSAYKKKHTKVVLRAILIVPIYLLVLFIVLLSYNKLFIASNVLGVEKQYISYNIEDTVEAYGIEVSTVDVQDGGTISEEIINKNIQVLNNVIVADEDLILQNLNSSLTDKGLYAYNSTKLGEYEINGKKQLVYITPREIVNENATYDTKTYEYTHGYGVIATLATNTDEKGNLISYNEKALNIKEPRIYYGLKTNGNVVTDSQSKQEFDYTVINEETLETKTQTCNYKGNGGIQLNYWDKVMLGLSQGDANLIFSNKVNAQSKILTNRNVIQRAKQLMPYLVYDEKPYIVINNAGELIWVIDAYTVSNYYPYSQKTNINGQEFNYIRNSVKVLVNAYDGDIEFYITDRTDPIVMTYRNMYPDLFVELDKELPQDISKHFVYPEYLYNIQSAMIERYHNTEADELYRENDVWDKAILFQNDKQTDLKPYYSIMKVPDEDKEKIGLVNSYTLYGKQNIISYLVGTYKDGNPTLKLYVYPDESEVLGLTQFEAQIEQNSEIYSEIKKLDITGTELIKIMTVIPVDNTLLYIESIYQQYINETDSVPTLKKVVVASGTKVAIGDEFEEALKNLASQYAINILIENTDDIDDLLDSIIKVNNNLQQSSQSGDWEMIGKDLQELQRLLDKLEQVRKSESKTI